MRDTFYLGRKAGSSLLHSIRTAEQIGRPLNTYVTINFWEFGSTPDTIFRDFADLRKNWFQRWSNYEPRTGAPKNGAPTYTYVHEAPKDLPHTHWIVHIDPENVWRFKEALTSYLKKKYRLAELPDGCLDIKSVYNGEGLKLYLSKGINPIWGDLWGIETEPCGRVAYRRADTSRNLGPSVRAPFIAAYKAQKRGRAA